MFSIIQPNLPKVNQKYLKQIMLSTNWYADFARELRAVLLEHAG